MAPLGHPDVQVVRWTEPAPDLAPGDVVELDPELPPVAAPASPAAPTASPVATAAVIGSDDVFQLAVPEPEPAPVELELEEAAMIDGASRPQAVQLISTDFAFMAAN